MAPSSTPPAGIRERWRSLRDRLLASQRFQAWAASHPLTRGIATRRARALFDLCAGFVYSQVLFACVKLKMFETLAAGPQSAGALAEQWRMPVDAAQRLLSAAESLELVEVRGSGVFGLGELGAALLGNPGVMAMIEHHSLLYADLQDPVALLRDSSRPTRLAQYWAYASQAAPAELSGDRITEYTRLMGASQQLIAADILDAFPFEQHRCLLDVGGGNGSFAVAATRRFPHLKAMVFDLPGVAREAAAEIASKGLTDRISTHGGDAFATALPRGADLVSLVRVLHDHNDDRALTLLRSVRQALAAGGTVLIAEPMGGASGTPTVTEAYFNFYLLAMGQGRPRSPETISQMLRDAGFKDPWTHRTRRPLQTQLISARTAP